MRELLSLRMPMVKVIGKPCDRKGHARIDEEGLETELRCG